MASTKQQPVDEPQQQADETRPEGVDEVPWREAMDKQGFITDIDPGHGLSDPDYVAPAPE